MDGPGAQSHPNPYAVTEEIPPGQTQTVEAVAEPADIDLGRNGIPWEGNGPLLRRFFVTLGRMYRGPDEFFRQMPRRGGVVRPAVFDFLSAELAVMISISLQSWITGRQPLQGAGPMETAGMFLGGPLLSLSSSLLMGLLIHGVLLISGRTFGIAATMRANLYANGGAEFLIAIPFAGSLISVVVVLFFSMIAIKQTQDTSWLRASAAVFGGLLLIVVAVLAIFAIGLLTGLISPDLMQ